MTILEPGEPGGPQAASFGNAGWLSSHSVLPPSAPGLWRQVPGFLRDPLGPLALRWRYLAAPEDLPTHVKSFFAEVQSDLPASYPGTLAHVRLSL